MLTLTADQVQRLQALQAARDQQRLGSLLATAFPDVPTRLGERYPAFIAHAVQRAASHGLHHAACVGRYLACWCVLGADFETRPGHEAALALLSDPDRGEGAKVFPLCRRVREQLSGAARAGAAGSAPALTADAFDAVLARLDEALQDRGAMGALQRGPRIALGAPCDIDAIDLRATEGPRQRYARVDGAWRRAAAPGAPAAVTVGGGPRALAALPGRLSLLAAAPGGVPGRLRLRCLAATCCDPALHPLVTLADAHALRAWRGPLAADVSLDLLADAPEPAPPGALQPRLAAPQPPRLALLGVVACGLRDGGPPRGEQQTQLAVHAAEQHLMAWHRGPRAPMTWPSTASEAGSAPTALRLERDGSALDTRAWRAGWEDLDTQLSRGLDRLHTAWGRESGLERTTQQAEPALLTGDAGLAWGWTEGASLADAAAFRVAGHLDLLACALQLRLTGELALAHSTSRLTLACEGQARLQAAWDSTAGDPAAGLAPAPLAFRLPFVLQVEPVAGASAALLDSSPASGAIAGSCGLRPRADGQGLQWFLQLAVEPVLVALRVHDPLLGETVQTRCLLPAMPLVDWSLG